MVKSSSRHKSLNRLSLFRNQAGTSLVELLVGVGISLIVITVITTSLVQFMLVSRWGNQQLLATNSLQTASLWLGRDIPEAHSFSVGSGNIYGTFSWEDSSQQFQYRYDPTEQTLVRLHIEDGNPQSTLTAARYISDQGDVTFNVNGNLVTVSITASRGDVAETLSLDLTMRSK
jgi:Tfp pilus assembly protein PilW